MLGNTPELLKEWKIDELESEVFRLAKKFLAEPICPANQKYHTAVLDEQCEAIRKLRELKSTK